ncbi:MAG: DUF151 domain-containing protein [Nitrosopumilaceae archaeon]
MVKKLNNIRKKSIQIFDVDEGSEVLKIEKIGISNLGQGVVILKTDGGKEFPISAFSAETAKNISDFQEGKTNQNPLLYNMLEEICETVGVFLVKVRIFQNGKALRANLYFTGKKEIILRNYRASDAIALACFYKIPILVKKELIHQQPEINP